MKIQFNATSGKDFRNTMAKYYNAKHQLNDVICKRTSLIKNYQDILDTNLEDIAKIDAGDASGVIKSRDELETEAKDIIAKIKAEQAILDKAREKAKTACEKAVNTVTDAMFEAAKAQDDATFNKAFASYLVANGFDTATPENVPVLHFGVKANGAKKACKTGELNGFMSKSAWTTIFLNMLADTLLEQKIIDPYKYTFDPDKNKKSK